MLTEYFKLGIKNLRHRQLRSLLTMIGIFIGIATVVSLIALGQGLKDAIGAQFNTLGADRLIISAKGGGFGPPGQGTAVKLTESDLKVVQRSSYVDIATGRLLGSAQVQFNDELRARFIGSLPPDAAERKLTLDAINAEMLEGHFPKSTDGYRVAVGNDFSKSDLFGKPVRVGDNLIIDGKKVEVVGVLKRKGSPQFDSSIFMNEGPMRDLLDKPDEYSAIIAQVADVSDVNLAKLTIEKNLRSSRNVDEGKEDFSVETSADILDSFSVIINGVTAVLVGIAAISLVVGGIGIMNTMYTSVLERTREIGIMKAVGATNEAILTIFLFESGMLGLAGGVIGVLLGWLLSQGVAIIGTAALGPGLIQAHVSLGLVFASLAFGFFVGAIAGTFPAYEASKLPPVEALRG